jgi:hypothetical protein
MIANKVTERNKLTNSVLTQIRKYEAMANFAQAPQLRFDLLHLSKLWDFAIFNIYIDSRPNPKT